MLTQILFLLTQSPALKSINFILSSGSIVSFENLCLFKRCNSYVAYAPSFSLHAWVSWRLGSSCFVGSSNPEKTMCWVGSWFLLILWGAWHCDQKHMLSEAGQSYTSHQAACLFYYFSQSGGLDIKLLTQWCWAYRWNSFCPSLISFFPVDVTELLTM